jgi:hypothetical protein
VRPLIAAVLLAGVLVGGVGCGGDDAGAEEERERLVDSLGFLATDLGLSDDEVACTAEAIEEGREGEDLDEVTAAVRRVDAGEVGLDELPGDVSATITESVASCAGSS